MPKRSAVKIPQTVCYRTLVLHAADHLTFFCFLGGIAIGCVNVVV
jgi:hypothetical protein